jgi:hypothetical protein
MDARMARSAGCAGAADLQPEQEARIGLVRAFLLLTSATSNTFELLRATANMRVGNALLPEELFGCGVVSHVLFSVFTPISSCATQQTSKAFAHRHTRVA